MRGRHFPLPPASGGEVARLHVAPGTAELPVYLAAVGPVSLELAGELGDGWIGVFCSPGRVIESLRHVAEGRAGKGRAQAGEDLTGFEVLPSIPISVGDDARAAAEHVRGYFATFIGLGSRERSIYHRLVCDLGFGDAADEIRARHQAGDRAGAAQAVPFELMDAVSLLGSAQRIAPRMAEYERAGVTTLGLTPLATTAREQIEALRVAAAALRLAQSDA
jgi:alkanesulfonate monooxygenase SsuD/methylene tetrahydromethanopterin reductase-like flavin-dependent oxidoreductase (luciferase family)